MAAAASRGLLVDVHTHVYLPRYVSFLRSRTAVPRVFSRSIPEGGTEERLLILDAEPSGGRPMGPQYYERDLKLKFMEKHGIDISIISALPHLKGIIMGSRGLGKGLDDDALEPVWAALEKAGLVVFLHPHYGVDGKEWGDKENGHVLPLALGFPFETTIAVTRLILSGVLDRYPNLRMLLAHSGGALPQLSSRLASCIDHDPVVASRLKHDARFYLGKLYFDAVAYGSEELGFVSDVIGRADKFTQNGSSAGASAGAGVEQRRLGSRRMMFGTDHPFFPPLKETDKWKSVLENLEAIEGVYGWSEEDKAGVRGGNALALFGLQNA
ncbi:hypothetical protein EVJ58_g422 [Rhodofomes roseus]|uniref:Amidohydrolase-related domain-containing protein n=1 Tax=Rhodofomes roseus TaxID=34475 RepID=A0A4Y9Z5U9_9APHY|nr:hypothetical protein EVJ58_g422 [Rhodofomes roseus]